MPVRFFVDRRCLARRFALLALTVGVGACGGGGDAVQDPPIPAIPTTLEVAPTTHTLTSLGDTARLTATIKDQNGAAMSASVTWASADPAVASVAAGVVVAVTNGTARITASVGSLTSSATITVQQVATQATVAPAVDTLESIGETVQLTAAQRDGRGNPLSAVTNFTWTSTDPSVATVSPTGLVTAVANGSAVITAEAFGRSVSASILVRQRATTIRVTPAVDTLVSLGATTQLSATASDARGQPLPGSALAWTSSNPAVATVLGNGLVTAVANGTTTVTVTGGGGSASAQVVVRQVPAQLSVTPDSLMLSLVGARATVTAIVRDARGNVVAGPPIAWQSSSPTVATVVSATGGSDASVTAVGAGRAVITASGAALSATTTVHVPSSATMVVEPIDPYLAAPAAGHLWEIPVLVVRYLPTTDGVNLDIVRTGFPRPPSHPGPPSTLADVRRRIDAFDRRVKFMLEEGSRFRGYADAAALPSLGYRIVQYITIYEPLPPGRDAGPCLPQDCQGRWSFPDYHAVLQRINAEHWVNTRGVKEIWVWGYHYAGMVQPESNMSSPTTGDISNSYRWNDDLPIYSRTFTLYGYNYGRTQNEAVHNHGHQLEAILGHVEPNVFWKSFVGQSPDGKWITGRAGWTHMPPNTTVDYDYRNATPVLTDIEDWRADNSGAKKSLGADRWRHLVYNWPAGAVPSSAGGEDFAQGSDGRTEAQWYVYWMQNMPGRGNTIPFFAGQMTNWWQFTSDWDASIRAKVGLATVPNGFPIDIRNDYVGGILLSPGGTLNPGQSVTLYSPTPIVVRVWNCGKPNAGGCIMDPYTLTPGKAYRVMTHPSGPAANLTIVER